MIVNKSGVMGKVFGGLLERAREIELRVTDFKLLNESVAPPVSPSAYGQDLPNEELRLEYRYLDLRRQEMQRTLLLRDRMIRSMRNYFGDLGFVDVDFEQV